MLKIKDLLYFFINFCRLTQFFHSLDSAIDFGVDSIAQRAMIFSHPNSLVKHATGKEGIEYGAVRL